MPLLKKPLELAFQIFFIHVAPNQMHFFVAGRKTQLPVSEFLFLSFFFLKKSDNSAPDQSASFVVNEKISLPLMFYFFLKKIDNFFFISPVGKSQSH
jgi:hypothetical protein